MSDMSGSQPPGWYYAQGDPPGTQRYWDGSQWTGAPQPVGGAADPGFGGMAATGQFATAGDRFVAFLIDYGIVLAAYVAILIVTAIFGAISDTLGTLIGLLAWLAVVAYSIYNWIYLQGTTGQTFGKKYRGIKLVEEATQQPVGPLMAFVRGLLQAVFAIPCYLDHWWILIDKRNQRLSDNVLKYVVVKA